MRNHYTEEFKAEAIRLVTEQGYSQGEAGRRLGIPEKNISRWVLARKEKEKKGKVEVSEEELKRLRKENERLKMEREILKKAAAFFANERS